MTDHARQLPSRHDKEENDEYGEAEDDAVNEYAITTPKQKTESTRRTPAVTTRSLGDKADARSGSGASTSEASIKSSADSALRRSSIIILFASLPSNLVVVLTVTALVNFVFSSRFIE